MAFIKNYAVKLSKETGVHPKDVLTVIKALEAMIHERLLYGEHVSMSKVGTIETRVRSLGRAYDLKSKTVKSFKPRVKARFICSPTLDKKLKQKKVYTNE